METGEVITGSNEPFEKTLETNSQIPTVTPQTSAPFTKSPEIFVTIDPKSSSPIITNRASAPPLPHPKLNPLPVISPTTQTSPIPLHFSTMPLPFSKNPSTHHQYSPPQLNPLPIPQPQTLVEKIRASEDKSLTRLAPVSFAPSGRPRIKIPDTVFQKGAELHKDFIICYFNGRAPPFSQIQSVLSHMWGKGRQLEIHNNPINHSTLVRIPSEYLRQKILEKSIWYVGDSMFHTAQWSSEHTKATPPLKAIKIWAHLTGVPLDLRYNEGLSLVAGLVGDPKETDDFTKNLVSLSVSHVKVEVDLTQPLPPVVEFERDCGEVVEVQVHYPWIPPKCSHCQELGHIARNCLLLPPPHKEPAAPKSAAPKAAKNKQPSQSAVYRKKSHLTGSSTDQTPKLSNVPFSSDLSPAPHPVAMAVDIASKPSVPSPSFPSPLAPFNNFSSPEPTPRPSLKRSRSSPTLSPPLSSNPNPFLLTNLSPVTSLFIPPQTSGPPFLKAPVPPLLLASNPVSSSDLSFSFVARDSSPYGESLPPSQ
ncbi:hypothetical protein BRARA_G01294 [Brassica rapa]|uniref:CCHC-type domain-containing protein n=1 Tax=Brassica campestris TaxID=3711 RepID=A0A397YVD4_BRACM|nr:hypothetical protein BRARA_G01294 [Brassica rapa]